MKTGELLAICREIKGLSQRDVEAATGISCAFICQLEKHNRMMGFDVAITLCDFYGITLDRLAELVRKNK